MCAKTVMSRSSKIIRWLSLSLLFGGSIAVVVAAVTLVKAAEAQGIPATTAASANAPVFVLFSKISLAAGFALLVGESIDYAWHRRLSKLLLVRYAASLLCAATTMIFALAIVPPMEQLRTVMATDSAAHQDFKKLHEASRVVFSATILLALISLVIPAFQKEESALNLLEAKAQTECKANAPT